jgi:hypothetical protein
MYREEAAVFVHLAAHEFQNILFLITGVHVFEGSLYFRTLGFVFFILGKFKQCFEIFHFTFEIPPWLVAVLESLEFTHDFFGFGTVVPEISLSGPGFELGYTLRKVSVFKDASRYY